MKNKLHEAWKKHIRAEDYEAHMASVGQAQANAQLVREYFERRTLPAGASVLFAGAGTGQMFAYVPPQVLQNYDVTFSDINRRYLELLESRLRKQRGLRFRIIEDDIEGTKLSGPFNAVIAVLLLEHVQWRKAVGTLCALAETEVFVVVQQNPEELTTAITPSRTVSGTMAIFREVHPQLIPEETLAAEFAKHGWHVAHRADRPVADGKKMLGLTFQT